MQLAKVETNPRGSVAVSASDSVIGFGFEDIRKIDSFVRILRVCPSTGGFLEEWTQNGKHIDNPFAGSEGTGKKRNDAESVSGVDCVCGEGQREDDVSDCGSREISEEDTESRPEVKSEAPFGDRVEVGGVPSGPQDRAPTREGPEINFLVLLLWEKMQRLEARLNKHHEHLIALEQIHPAFGRGQRCG